MDDSSFRPPLYQEFNREDLLASVEEQFLSGKPIGEVLEKTPNAKIALIYTNSVFPEITAAYLRAGDLLFELRRSMLDSEFSHLDDGGKMVFVSMKDLLKGEIKYPGREEKVDPEFVYGILIAGMEKHQRVISGYARQ